MIHLLPTKPNFTAVPNAFILTSMSKMSSSVIKIYLTLLYQFQQQYPHLDLDEIANSLNVTESDIYRTLAILEKENLLLCKKEDGKIVQLQLPESTGAKEPKHTVSPLPKKAEAISTNSQAPLPSPTLSTPPENGNHKEKFSRPVYNAANMTEFLEDKEGNQLVFFTETLLAKKLTTHDLHILYGLSDWLGMSSPLIYFLIEYCAEKNQRSLNYIEKIAINWHENNIKTIEQAKDYLATYPSHYYTVLKAYGIYNLAPIPSQIKMIDKWTKEYLFPIDIITLACEKTILSVGKPDFKYTDGILQKWKAQNLYTREKIEASSAEYIKKNYTKTEKNAGSKQNTGKTTSFNNYIQREEDYDAMEKKALEMLMKKKESKQ